MGKDKFWQAVRGLSIISVVLIHCMNGISFKTSSEPSFYNYHYWLILRQFINFPVATFIFLSGYFTNTQRIDGNSLKYFRTKILRLAIPYLIWSFAYIIYNGFINGFDFNLQKIGVLILTGRAATPFYFIVVLFQLMIITPIIVEFMSNKIFHTISLLVTPIYLIVLYVIMINTKQLVPNYELFFPAWFIFYYLGLYVKIKGKESIFTTKLKSSILIVIGTLVLSILECYSALYFGMSDGFAVTQIKISSFMYSISVINLLFAIKPLFSAKIPKLLVEIGDCSFGIYFVHCLFLDITYIVVLRYIPHISNILPIYQAIQLGLVIVCSLFSIIITKKVLGDKNASLLLGF